MTLGGMDKDGNDATNAVTYMMLQASGRLVLHDPRRRSGFIKYAARALGGRH
jgi:pyruvate-formate lyase